MICVNQKLSEITKACNIKNGYQGSQRCKIKQNVMTNVYQNSHWFYHEFKRACSRFWTNFFFRF